VLHRVVAPDRARLPSQVARQSAPARLALPFYCPLIRASARHSSNATSKTTRVGGSKELLWKPRIALLRTMYVISRNVRRKLGQVCDPRCLGSIRRQHPRFVDVRFGSVTDYPQKRISRQRCGANIGKKKPRSEPRLVRPITRWPKGEPSSTIQRSLLGFVAKVRGSGANSLKSARQAVGAECVTSFPALTAPTQPTKSRQLERWRRDTR